MVRPLKDDPNAEEVLKHKEKVELAKPKSKRTLILVRHGQYNISATTDSDRYLTETGKLQADITGQRLVSIVEYLKTRTKKDENGNMTPLLVNFVKSTMTRATETADIILKHFPDVNSHQSCDLIREGAPCPPEPPHPEWDPTPSVSQDYLVFAV
jgi:serine/threonine-protein phosphatase PGAM5